MKKLIIIILLFALAGCTTNTQLGADKNKVEKTEKLKAVKSKILQAKDVFECQEWKSDEKLECKKTEKVKQYVYISDKKVKQKTINYKGKELKEDISKRTKNSIHFKIEKDDELLGAGSTTTEEYLGLFYASNQFWYEDEEWYQTEVATTTIKVYEEQTATTTIESLISLFFNTVKATDYFPNGGYDDIVKNRNVSTWATCRNADTANSGIDTNTRLEPIVFFTGGAYYIHRAFLPFDTSSIGSGSTITGASLNLKTASTLGGSYGYSVLNGSQDGNSTLTNADFDAIVGFTDNTAIDSGDIGGSVSTGDITAGNYTEVTFNSNGEGFISKTSYTTLAIMLSQDVTNSTPSSNSRVSIYSSRQTGTDSDPYLSVTYSGGTPIERRVMLIP